MKKMEFKFSSLKLLITCFFSQLHPVVFFKVAQYPQRQESIDYHFQILILYLKTTIIEFPGIINNVILLYLVTLYLCIH